MNIDPEVRLDNIEESIREMKNAFATREYLRVIVAEKVRELAAGSGSSSTGKLMQYFDLKNSANQQKFGKLDVEVSRLRRLIDGHSRLWDAMLSEPPARTPAVRKLAVKKASAKKATVKKKVTKKTPVKRKK